MVESRRRTSLLGAFALLGGLASMVFTKLHVLQVQTVTIHSIPLPLGMAVGLGAAAVALIAFVAAASSPRTGTTLPIISILVCAGALVLAFKPNLFASRTAPKAAQSTPSVAAHSPAPAASATPAQENPAPHVKTIFDSDYPSSTPPSTARAEATRSSAGSNVPSTAAPHSPADAAAAVRAARDKLDVARANVLRTLESSDTYREAKAEAEAADKDLKAARLTYEPGSYKLITADKTAIETHKRVQKLINDAAAKDADCQAAERELRSAQSPGAHEHAP